MKKLIQKRITECGNIKKKKKKKKSIQIDKYEIDIFEGRLFFEFFSFFILVSWLDHSIKLLAHPIKSFTPQTRNLFSTISL